MKVAAARDRPSKRRARLEWEAACERLKNALEPPPDAPIGMPDLAESIRVAQRALDTVRAAFDLDTRA